MNSFTGQHLVGLDRSQSRRQGGCGFTRQTIGQLVIFLACSGWAEPEGKAQLVVLLPCLACLLSTSNRY